MTLAKEIPSFFLSDHLPFFSFSFPSFSFENNLLFPTGWVFHSQSLIRIFFRQKGKKFLFFTKSENGYGQNDKLEKVFMNQMFLNVNKNLYSLAMGDLLTCAELTCGKD